MSVFRKIAKACAAFQVIETQPAFDSPVLRFLFRAQITTDGEAWRVAVMGNEQVTLVIGWNLAELQAELGRYRNAFLIVAPASLLLLFVAGLWLARQALRPVRLIAQTAGHITARNLSQRIPHTSAAREFQHLIEVINNMLDRLERSFQQASRFSADAAHELKTPLTILQGQIDQALQHAPDGWTTFVLTLPRCPSDQPG